MKFFLILLIALFLSYANGFMLRPNIIRSSRTSMPVRMTKEPTNLVPIEKSTIETSVAFTGGFIGFVVGGPYLAAILAAASNYIVKRDDETGEAFRGVGKAVIESWNFLTKLNGKYDVTGKISDSLNKAIKSNALSAIDRAALLLDSYSLARAGLVNVQSVIGVIK